MLLPNLAKMYGWPSVNHGRWRWPWQQYWQYRTSCQAGCQQHPDQQQCAVAFHIHTADVPNASLRRSCPQLLARSMSSHIRKQTGDRRTWFGPPSSAAWVTLPPIIMEVKNGLKAKVHCLYVCHQTHHHLHNLVLSGRTSFLGGSPSSTLQESSPQTGPSPIFRVHSSLLASTGWSGVMLCRSQHSWRSSRSCASVKRRLHLDCDTGCCSRASVQRYRTQSSLPPSNITFQLQPFYTSMKIGGSVLPIIAPSQGVNEWRLASTSPRPPPVTSCSAMKAP